MNRSQLLRQEASATSKLLTVFVFGEKCLPRWCGAREFLTTVQKVLGHDIYEILFDDECMKVLKSAHISKLKIPFRKSQSSSKSVSPALHKPIANSTPGKIRDKGTGGEEGLATDFHEFAECRGA